LIFLVVPIVAILFLNDGEKITLSSTLSALLVHPVAEGETTYVSNIVTSSVRAILVSIAATNFLGILKNL